MILKMTLKEQMIRNAHIELFLAIRERAVEDDKRYPGLTISRLAEFERSWIKSNPVFKLLKIALRR